MTGDLDAYLESVAYKRFKWGEHDCCTFARDVVEIVTGTRHELPSYSTMREAANLVEANNGSIKDWVSRLLGEPFVPDASHELPECCVVQLYRTCGGTLVTSGEISDGPLGVWYRGSVYLPGRHALVKTSQENIIAAWAIT